jgi:UrcA family protein
MISAPRSGRRAPTAFISLLAILALPLVSMSTTTRSPFAQSTSAMNLSTGLDPSTASGARKLYRRIHQAALVQCGGQMAVSSDYRIESQDCYREAVANAVAQLNNPVLFTIHRAEVARLASR